MTNLLSHALKGTSFSFLAHFTGDLEKWRKRELKKEKKNSWKKKKKDKSVRKESAETGDDKGDKERKKEHRPMPNYFVAIQITNPKVINITWMIQI